MPHRGRLRVRDHAAGSRSLKQAARTRPPGERERLTEPKTKAFLSPGSEHRRAAAHKGSWDSTNRPRTDLIHRKDMAKQPESIGDILGELMARTGYARVQSADALQSAWQQVAGELAAKCTRAVAIRRGTLEVVATSSVVVQELTFRKSELLQGLAVQLPDSRISNLRFKVGPLP